MRIAIPGVDGEAPRGQIQHLDRLAEPAIGGPIVGAKLYQGPRSQHVDQVHREWHMLTPGPGGETDPFGDCRADRVIERIQHRYRFLGSSILSARDNDFTVLFFCYCLFSEVRPNSRATPPERPYGLDSDP